VSISSPQSFSQAVYGLGVGRGDLERQIIQTLQAWIVAYIADYERQQEMPPRTLPVPPVPESIHGSLDHQTFRGENFPEIVVIVQPTGTIERYDDGETYGSWYAVEVCAFVTVEGDQDATRTLADAYGTVLQKLIPQQGAFGLKDDGTDFATRTRLVHPYALVWADETVRDIVRVSLEAETFLDNLVSDWEGPRVPPQDPYAVPTPDTEAYLVEVGLIRGTPDSSGELTADAVILDGTVNPNVERLAQVMVDQPPDPLPKNHLSDDPQNFSDD
jgi:hypothetical protein